MATDFSIDALLSSPTKKSRNGPEQKIEEIPVRGRIFTPTVPLDSNGKYIWFVTFSRARKHFHCCINSSSEIELIHLYTVYIRTVRGK